MHSLKDIFHNIGIDVFLKLQPNIILRDDVRNRYLSSHDLALLILVVESQAVSRHLIILDYIIKKLIFNIWISGMSALAISWQFGEVCHI